MSPGAIRKSPLQELPFFYIAIYIQFESKVQAIGLCRKHQAYKIEGIVVKPLRNGDTMPDSIMYESDAYVVLEPNQEEQFLSATELLEKLKQAIQNCQNDQLPPELQQMGSLEEQAQHMMETYCEFTVEPGKFLQWYEVRLEK